MAGDSWRRMFGVVALTLAGFAVFTMVEPESVTASCVGPQEGGRWWNKNVYGDPISIEVALVQCGDQVLNGVQTSTTYGVTVFVKQSSGNLYQRPRAQAVYRDSNGKRWLYAKVPTGGYVDHIWLRPANESPRDQLYVYIKHESLDSKPDAESKHYFVRTRPSPPATAATGLTTGARSGIRVVPR